MQIVSRKIFSQYYNDSDFLSNLGDSNINLAGNVMELKRAVYTVNVDVRSQASIGNEFSINATTNSINRNFGSFIDDGFSIGDSFICDYDKPGGSVTFEGNIIAITDTQILFTTTSGTPITRTEDRFDIYLTSFLTGLNFNFGLVENNDSFNANSPFDSTTMGWYVDGVGVDTGGGIRSTAVISGQPLSFNINKSWVAGDFSAQFVQNVNNGFGNYIQQFQIIHTFIVFPYYLEGELTNLQTLSPPSLFNGSNSLKYVTKYEFRRVLSDPNSSKTLTDENILGSVGWFNEPFNGLNQTFSIQNLSYEDTSSNVIQRIVANTDTIVKFRVNSSTLGAFNNSTVLISYVSFLPNISEYQEKSSDFIDNFMYDSFRGTANGLNNIVSTPFVIKEALYDLINNENIDVTLKVDFNDTRLDNTKYYLISTEVASIGGDNQISDKTNLLTALDTFEKSNDVQGLITKNFMEFELYPDAVGTSQYTNFRGWVEDSINVNYNFTVNRTLNAVLNQLDAKIVAYNTNDGTWFELENVKIPLTSTIITGNQFISYDVPRSFNHPHDEYNRIKVSTGAINSTTPNYTVNLSLKMDWQDWLLLPDADTVFYDANKPNNGLNENSSNYSLKSNYEIRVLFVHEVEQSSTNIVTTYVHSSPQNEVYNYDLDDNITPVVSGVINTFDINNVDTGGTILNGQDNKIVATWSPNNLFPLSSYYGTILLEPINSPTKNAIKIYDASMSIVGSNVLGEVTIPSADIQNGITYKISSRLRCYEVEETPIARMVNLNFIGGINGQFNYDLEIRENDDTTPLQTGDLVRFELRNGVNSIETIEGGYGTDISTFTTISGTPASSVTNWASGIVQDGGTVQLNKKSWAEANGYGYKDGAPSGDNWASAAIELRIFITAYDSSLLVWSANTDNFAIYEKVFKTIEGSVMMQDGTPDPLFIYSMYNNDGISENLNEQTAFDLKYNSTSIQTSLPSFIPTNFNFGTRDMYTRNTIGSGTYNVRIDFENNMIAFAEYIGTGNEMSLNYNIRTSSGNTILDRFPQVLESSLSTLTTKYASTVQNSLNGGNVLNPSKLYVNASFVTDMPHILNLSATASESDWYDVDLSPVGERKTIRIDHTEGSNTVFIEFMAEINAIY